MAAMLSMGLATREEVCGLYVYVKEGKSMEVMEGMEGCALLRGHVSGWHVSL